MYFCHFWGSEALAQLPTEAVGAPSVEVLRARLDGALGSLSCWVAALLSELDGSLPSQPILWYDSMMLLATCWHLCANVLLLPTQRALRAPAALTAQCHDRSCHTRCPRAFRPVVNCHGSCPASELLFWLFFFLSWPWTWPLAFLPGVHWTISRTSTVISLLCSHSSVPWRCGLLVRALHCLYCP